MKNIVFLFFFMLPAAGCGKKGEKAGPEEPESIEPAAKIPEEDPVKESEPVDVEKEKVIDEKLETAGKGQFQSISIGFDSIEGDGCSISLYADGWMTTSNSVWSGFSCDYIKGVNYWPADMEKVYDVVALLAEPGVLAPKTEKTSTFQEDFNEYASVYTSQGGFVLSAGSKEGIKQNLEKIYKIAEAVEPRNQAGEIMILPKLRYISKNYTSTLRLDIEPSGVGVVLASGESGTHMYVGRLSAGDLTGLDAQLDNAPDASWDDPGIGDHPLKDDPAELRVVIIHIGDVRIRFFQNKPPEKYAGLTGFLQSLTKKLMSKE